MTAPLMTDGVAYIIAALRDALPDVRFVAELPDGTSPAWAGPLVMVNRVGGPSSNSGLDLPDLGIDCYAPTFAAAVALGTSIRATLWDLKGTTAAGAVCTQVLDVRGPFTAPYVNTNVRRQVVTASLALAAAP